MLIFSVSVIHVHSTLTAMILWSFIVCCSGCFVPLCIADVQAKKIDVHDAPLSPLYKLHSYCYWENFMTLEFGKCDFVFRKFTQLLVLL